MTKTTDGKNVKEIYFEEGVPGFKDYKKFHLRDFENSIYAPLKLMTSADNSGLTFILYPHINGNSVLSDDVKGELLAQTGLSDDNCDFFTIVRVEEPNGHLFLSTNLKAPILIDHKKNRGWQHILSTRDLSTTHPLDCFSKTLRARRGENCARKTA